MLRLNTFLRMSGLKKQLFLTQNTSIDTRSPYEGLIFSNRFSNSAIDSCRAKLVPRVTVCAQQQYELFWLSGKFLVFHAGGPEFKSRSNPSFFLLVFMLYFLF